MIRMKNRINQVVVGGDYINPQDCDILNIWHSKDITKGKVVVDGKRRPVEHIGGGVWMLTDGTNTIPLKEAM